MGWMRVRTKRTGKSESHLETKAKSHLEIRAGKRRRTCGYPHVSRLTCLKSSRGSTCSHMIQAGGALRLLKRSGSGRTTHFVTISHISTTHSLVYNNQPSCDTIHLIGASWTVYLWQISSLGHFKHRPEFKSAATFQPFWEEKHKKWAYIWKKTMMSL